MQTYWQTETGSNVITPLAGVTPTKPGSASLPFFGIEPAIIDPVSGEEIHGNDVEGVLAFKQAWPSMARTVWGAHKRYMDTYLNVYKGYYVRPPSQFRTHNPLTSLQFTGDGAGRDHEGFYWIRGRVDDVVNVSGHRLSTAEIEAALIEHSAIAEAAVVGVADELTGQAVNAFVALKDGNDATDALRKEFILQVRKSIGPFAAPKAVYIVSDLPKTRSGKIMRRILRKILAGEEDQLGDISTVCLPCGGVWSFLANGGGCSFLIRGLWTRLLLLFMMPRSKRVQTPKEKKGLYIGGAWDRAGRASISVEEGRKGYKQ